MKVVFRDHEWTIRKEYWSAIDSTSQSPTSSVERRKRQFRSWLEPREWRREKSKTSESIPLLQVWNQCQLRHYQQTVQARPPTVILTIGKASISSATSEDHSLTSSLCSRWCLWLPSRGRWTRGEKTPSCWVHSYGQPHHGWGWVHLWERITWTAVFQKMSSGFPVEGKVQG